MPENPFEGATRDPIGLLEQLIARVADISRDLSEFKTEMSEFKTEMSEFKTEMSEFKTETRGILHDIRQEVRAINTRLDGQEARLDRLHADLRKEAQEIRSEITGLRTDIRLFLSKSDQDLAALKVQIDNSVDRKVWVATDRLRDEVQIRYEDLERRITALEEHRKRQDEKGA